MPQPTMIQYDNLFAEMLLGPKCDLFKGTDGDVYISVDTPHGKATLPLDSQEGLAVATNLFHTETDHIISTSERERGARLAYSKILWNPTREVFLRVGKDATHYYLDLKTQPKTYVRFNADGWQITDTVPVHFREGQGQLLMSLKPGISDDNAGFGILRGLLRLSEPQWKCLLPLLVSYLLPDIQHPLLLLTGEQNSGKSTFLEVVKTLIDPNSAAIGGDVPDPRNLFIKVNSTWVSTFDNLSKLDDKQQDAICQIVTGGTYQTRRLYSDAGLVSITCKNPVILSGITNVANRGDIASRAVLFELQSIDRQANLVSAETITAKLQESAPSILRALLNLTVAVLKVRGQITAPPNVRPAAYGIIGRAVEQVMGWRPGSFEQSYHITRQSLHDDVVEKHAVMGALLQYLQPFQTAGEHTVATTVLLAQLAVLSDESVTRSNLWPKTAAAFGKVLMHSAPALRKQYGWDAQQSRDMHARYWKFTYIPPKTAAAKLEATVPVVPLPQQRETLGQSVRRVRKTKHGKQVPR